MACKYKYNNSWYSKEELQSILYKERGIDKYGKLVKPDTSKKILKSEKVYEVRWKNGGVIIRTTDLNKAKAEMQGEYTDAQGNKLKTEDVVELVEGNPIEQIGIQPTQTNKTLKESIESVKNKIESFQGDISEIPNKFEGYTKRKETGEKLYQGIVENINGVWKINNQIISEEQVKKLYVQEKEYTSQAETNLKIAALKEVAKKYPRSLIRSEVVPIAKYGDNVQYEMFDVDELPLQKIPSKEVKPGVEELFNESTELANQIYEALGFTVSELPIIDTENIVNRRALNQITPEQKQQAQQLYSQYLDQIFPDSKVKDIVYHGTNLNFDKFDKDRIGSNTAVKGEKPSFSFSNNRKQAEAYSSEITVGQNTNELAGVWFEENQHIFKNGDITTGVIDENNVIEHYKKELENSKEMISPTGEIDPLTNKYKLIPVNNKTLKQLAEIKTKEWQKEYNTLLTVGPKVMSVIIDVKNPKIVDFKGEKKSIKFKEEQKNTIGDAFIAKNIDDWGKGDVIQVFEPEQIHILGSKEDIQGFKEFVNTEIEHSNLSFSPREQEVKYSFKAVENTLKNINKVNQWYKQLGNTDKFWNKLQQDLQIPREQVNLLKESEGSTIEEKLTSFATNYSFVVEINVATQLDRVNDDYNSYLYRGESEDVINISKEIPLNFTYNGDSYTSYIENEDYLFGRGEDITYYTKNSNKISVDEYRQAYKQSIGYITEKPKIVPTSYHSDLTVPGGTNYTENEISTPLITPSIKGHAQFATDKGIGWFRSDDKYAFTGFLEDLLASGTIKKVPCG